MFSVNRKTSIKTLQMITGILSMSERIQILKPKWAMRYQQLSGMEKMLLPIVEEFIEKINIPARSKEIKADITKIFSADFGKEIAVIVKKKTNEIFDEL